MSEGKSELVRTTEKRVREIFAAARHEVSEAVGERPGEVVFFAEEPRRAGRLRIHWVVWEQCPEDLDAALDALDEERTHLSADRALAVIAQGSLPQDYRHDLHANRVNAFTVRRLTFELMGVFEFLRNAAVPPPEAPHHPDQFLPRRGITEQGDSVSAVEYIEDLLTRGGPWLLLVEGLGGRTLFSHLVYRQAQASVVDPDRGTPLLSDDVFPPLVVKNAWFEETGAPLLAPHAAWSLDGYRSVLFSNASDLAPRSRFVFAYQGRVDWLSPGLANHSVFKLRLLTPDDHELHAWYRSRLPAAAYARLTAAWERSTDVATIARHLVNLVPVRMAAIQATESSDSPQTWLARFIVHYASRQVSQHEHARADGQWREGLSKDLEDAALEEFALGRSSPRLAEILQHIRRTPTMQWFELDEKDRAVASFANRLIRDYFLARKIAAEVRTHGPDIFARYQFPQEHVLLFLAVIAPEVAAQATADRSAEMRVIIQEEIENRLQLTLAHQLKRSVGALQTNLGRVRRALPDAMHTQYTQELARIDDEIGFLKALAESTRRWHEVPEERVEDISVLAVIDGALSQLRDTNTEVAIIRDIAPDMLVRADRQILREILYCLLENAFQAAGDPMASQPPQVEVRAVHEGADVVRIEVLDSGPGVDPADRERIFEPRVTTKKGGPGRPQGTGMGLAIARKYAHAIGGRVEIDLTRPQTCFVLKLVAGGMNRG
jgi:signal transduction histidine kinase